MPGIVDSSHMSFPLAFPLSGTMVDRGGGLHAWNRPHAIDAARV